MCSRVQEAPEAGWLKTGLNSLYSFQSIPHWASLVSQAVLPQAESDNIFSFLRYLCDPALSCGMSVILATPTAGTSIIRYAFEAL